MFNDVSRRGECPRITAQAGSERERVARSCCALAEKARAFSVIV